MDATSPPAPPDACSPIRVAPAAIIPCSRSGQHSYAIEWQAHRDGVGPRPAAASSSTMISIRRWRSGACRHSRSRIFASLLMYRGSRIDVSRKASTMVVAASIVTRVEPRARTLAPLCWRAYRASVWLMHMAARIPLTLFAAIVDPMPEPSMTIPASASPRAT